MEGMIVVKFFREFLLLLKKHYDMFVCKMFIFFFFRLFVFYW